MPKPRKKPASFPNHDAAVAYCEAELAKGVKEVPLGSNRGSRVEHYQTFDWIPGGGYPWCVDLDQAAWSEGAGHPLPWPTAGAHDFGDRAHAAGWTTTIDKLIPGDLINWQIGTGHLSMFLSYKNGIVRTIDGNVSDRVAYRERSASLIRYAIHVPEDPAKIATVPKPKPPMFEVVTSENGHSKIVYVSGQRAVSRKLGELLNRYGGVTIRRRKEAP